MASYYVYSGAGGAGTGADWTNAYTTLAAAVTSKATSDVFYVADDHAETSASTITISPPNLSRIYCVRRSGGSVPPVSADLRTTATITTTGSVSIVLSQGDVLECNGIIFNSGTGGAGATLINANSSAGAGWRFVNCSFRLIGPNLGSRINIGSSSGAGLTIMENVTVQFSHVSQLIKSQNRTVWRNTPSAILGSTFPVVLFQFNVGQGSIFMEGVDLSASGSSTALFDNTAGFPIVPVMKDCKIGASAPIVSAAFATGFGGMDVTLVRCDSGDTNYRTERHNYMGRQEAETTIVRTDGASDGTTTISWLITSSTNCTKYIPFEALPISIWNETVGSAVTLTIQCITAAVSAPNNDEIWIDCEYLGTSGYPLASRATSGRADTLATPTACPSGSGTWGGGTTKFKMSATMTPQEKGPITIYVKVGANNRAFYIDPKPEIG